MCVRTEIVLIDNRRPFKIYFEQNVCNPTECGTIKERLQSQINVWTLVNMTPQSINRLLRCLSVNDLPPFHAQLDLAPCSYYRPLECAQHVSSLSMKRIAHARTVFLATVVNNIRLCSIFNLVSRNESPHPSLFSLRPHARTARHLVVALSRSISRPSHTERAFFRAVTSR